MKIKKKLSIRSFTLMEVVLGMALLALLLTALFSSYHRLAEKNATLTHSIKHLDIERHLFTRLETIFHSVDSEEFFTKIHSRGYERDALVFTFDRGPFPEPSLAHKVLGQFYVDEKQRTLCLGIWPDPKSGFSEPNEVWPLLEDVDSLSFSFYAAPNPLALGVHPPEVGTFLPLEGWQKEWQRNYADVPALMKISIIYTPKGQKEKKTLEMAFSLPGTHTIVYPYQEGKT